MSITPKAVLSQRDRVQNGSLIVLLRGPPGSGETHVAKSVAWSLDCKKHLAASLFFEKGVASLDLFISTLAAQIAERNPRFRSNVEQIIFDTASILRQPPTVQIRRLTVNPICSVYANKLNLIQNCFIVIDGLGECWTPDDLNTLNSLMAGLQDLPARFRFFVSLCDKLVLPYCGALAVQKDDILAISTPLENERVDK